MSKNRITNKLHLVHALDTGQVAGQVGWAGRQRTRDTRLGRQTEALEQQVNRVGRQADKQAE